WIFRGPTRAGLGRRQRRRRNDGLLRTQAQSVGQLADRRYSAAAHQAAAVSQSAIFQLSHGFRQTALGRDRRTQSETRHARRLDCPRAVRRLDERQRSAGHPLRPAFWLIADRFFCNGNVPRGYHYPTGNRRAPAVAESFMNTITQMASTVNMTFRQQVAYGLL